MKTLNILYSFLVTWGASIFLLLIAGVVTEAQRPEPRFPTLRVSEFVFTFYLFVVSTFLVLAPVWGLLVAPCFYAARRYVFLQHRLRSSLAAALAGFGWMYGLMRFLPVEYKQWPIFCSIASVVGFLSAFVLLARSSPRISVAPESATKPR